MYLHRIVPSAFLIFIFCFITELWAQDYFYVYQFEKPNITTLPTGLDIVTLEDTWQREAIPGEPIIPVRTAKIFIPADEEIVSLNILQNGPGQLDGFYKIQYGTAAYPLSYDGPIPTQIKDAEIYSTDAFYPGSLYTDRGFQYLHGIKILLVDLFPVSYNPVAGQIQYYDTLKIEITTQQLDDTIQKLGSRSTKIPFRDLPRDTTAILNFIDNDASFSEKLMDLDVPALTTDVSTGADNSREFLIITTEALETTFQTLATYRESTAGGGFTTYIESVESIVAAAYAGDDLAEKIRNFIIDCYTNYGTQFVVLGGDADGIQANQVIPTRGVVATVATTDGDTTDSYIPSDLYYGCLDGTWNSDGDELWGESTDGVGGGDIDWQSEVYVGRIPADNATEVSNLINKIISFETGVTPYKTLLVGESMDDTPTWGGDRMDWLYGWMDSMPNSQIYERDWSGNDWSSTELIHLINTNEYNWINHLGHATTWYDMKMYDSSVSSLTNSTYNFIYTQGCYPGSFDNRGTSTDSYGDDSWAEEITVGYGDRGAAAIIANSRYGWYNPGSSIEGASNLLHKEFIESVFTDNNVRIGMANQISKTDLDLSQGIYRWIAFETNLLGDPATRINGTCDDSILGLLIDSPVNQFVAEINEETVVTAMLTSGCGDAMIGASVSAMFSNGDQTLSLYDDGTHSDGEANDGVYGNVWTPDHEFDSTVVTVNASLSGYTATSTTVSGEVIDVVSYSIDDTVPFNWLDISATGTVLIDAGDEVVKTLTFDFPFTFYGVEYTSFWVTSNGFASFNSASSAYKNTDIPDESTPNALLAPFWDDLNIRSGIGRVIYQTIGTSPNRNLVVTWENVDRFGSYLDEITFQIVLSEASGTIKFQYLDTAFANSSYDNGKSATIGIESSDGTYGDKYSYNSASVSNEMAILFTETSDEIQFPDMSSMFMLLLLRDDN